MGKGSGPKPPDPYQTAKTQYEFNTKAMQDTLKANAMNRYGPYGSTTFIRDASGMPVGQEISLSPNQQALLGARESNALGLQGAAANMLDYLPTDAPIKFNPTSVPTGAEVGQAAFDYQKGLLQPGFDRARRDLTTELTNRGIPVGSEAWNNAMNQLDESQGAQMTNAANQAYVTGTQAQNQFWNQAVQGHGVSLADREQPFRELSSYLAAAPQFQLPGFVDQPQANVQAPDYTNAAYQSYQAQAQAAQNKNNSLMSGLMGIGKMVLPFVAPGIGTAASVGLSAAGL